MDETPDEMLTRLRAMAVPGQQTWDLSDRDQAAIRWAVSAVDGTPHNGVDLIAKGVVRALDAKADHEGVEVAVYVVAQDGRRLRRVRRIKTAPNHTPIVEDGNGWDGREPAEDV